MSKPQKIYSENIEQGALDQFESAMTLPFSVKGALMPDAHQGYSLPIGGVVATDGVILPSWVGYDIGCGMSAICTSIKKEDISQENRQKIFHEIYRAIPTGLKHGSHEKEQVPLDHTSTISPVVFKLIVEGAYKQLGTLGSGNHFIEIGYDEEDRVWIIVHSGSRGLGYKTAQHYMRLASGDGKAREGHYGFNVDSFEGKSYIVDMNFCLEFALESRKRMVYEVRSVLHEILLLPEHADLEPEFTLINRNHNHAEFKDGLWIHRKGATHAEKGMWGVIPGNMRDGSFIVKGKGNPDSLYSSSHGAGRVKARRQAKREIPLADFQEAMQGITAKVEESTLDEAPQAYKDIHRVMDEQSDLVEVIHHIKPLINVKG